MISIKVEGEAPSNVALSSMSSLRFRYLQPLSVAKLKPRTIQLVPLMNITLKKVSLKGKLTKTSRTHSPPKSNFRANVRQEASHVLERCTWRRDAEVTRKPTRQTGKLR